LNEKGANVLSRLLAPERVVVTDEIHDKWEAIRHLVDVFVESGAFPEVERQRILNAVYERERKMSTGIEHGIAIPHGVYDGLPGELGVLGIFRGGVDFQARDGKPSDLVIMLLYPPDARQEHIQNLSEIVRTFSSPDVCLALRGTQHPQDAYERLTTDP
jgi:mannitol/fructose-specific phosphotransferase system IIA component (Ntr-type)